MIYDADDCPPRIFLSRSSQLPSKYLLSQWKIVPDKRPRLAPSAIMSTILFLDAHSIQICTRLFFLQN